MSIKTGEAHLAGLEFEQARTLIRESALTAELKRVIAELLAESRPLRLKEAHHGRE